MMIPDQDAWNVRVAFYIGFVLGILAMRVVLWVGAES